MPSKIHSLSDLVIKYIIAVLAVLPLFIFCREAENWIVVTTIHYPTEALKKLAKLSDWQLLVIGDKKTPKDWYLDEKCIYLSPEEQEKLPYELVKHLPWNHYSRKNIGYLYAIEHGARFIYETDDDNYVINTIHSVSSCPVVTLCSKESVVNVYSYFGQPDVWPRGYPLSQIHNKANIEISEEGDKKIVIEQGLVNNEPDVDAIFRLTRNASCGISFENRASCILAKRNFCPFNTQNTLFHREAFWGLYIPTHVPFRVCDIWRSYLTQRLLWETDGHLCFTSPSAIQERNSHDLMKDFLDEQVLYLKTDQFIHFLLQWKYSDINDILYNLYDLYSNSIRSGFIGDSEDLLIQAWIKDFKKVQSFSTR